MGIATVKKYTYEINEWMNTYQGYIFTNSLAVSWQYIPKKVALIFSLLFKTLAIFLNRFKISSSTPVILAHAVEFEKNLLEVLPSLLVPNPGIFFGKI